MLQKVRGFLILPLVTWPKTHFLNNYSVMSYVAESDHIHNDDWLKSNENMYNKDDLEQSRKDALTKNSIVKNNFPNNQAESLIDYLEKILEE